ncbi:unnamed protein product, partial [Urochloa humidicola]
SLASPPPVLSPPLPRLPFSFSSCLHGTFRHRRRNPVAPAGQIRCGGETAPPRVLRGPPRAARRGWPRHSAARGLALDLEPTPSPRARARLPRRRPRTLPRLGSWPHAEPCGIRLWLGTFPSAEAAALVYAAAAHDIHGPRPKINFPSPTAGRKRACTAEVDLVYNKVCIFFWFSFQLRGSCLAFGKQGSDYSMAKQSVHQYMWCC